MPDALDIPAAWKALRPNQLHGLIMVIGAPDSGKSTFCRYLYSQLLAQMRPCAYLDGDPGQTFLGPPTTLSLASGDLQHPTQVWRRFVASLSPRGNMLTPLSTLKPVAALHLSRLSLDPQSFQTLFIPNAASPG